VARIDRKLGNPDFLARAPEEVVDEQKARREEAEEALSRLKGALDRLG
jgi:valyl-tRNA synthetase